MTPWAPWWIWFSPYMGRMTRIFLGLVLALTLSACFKDETVTGYGGDRLWQLSELDGTPFTARATIRFDKDGKVSGQAACNRYFTQQSAPYPWVEFGPIGSTKMACPDLEDETTYLGALAEMSLVEISGDVMILSNDAGRKMVFTAAQDGG